MIDYFNNHHDLNSYFKLVELHSLEYLQHLTSNSFSNSLI